MENYVILNGTNSNTINGLLIQELPPISKPAIRTQVDEIDGRDGDIVTKLGYSAYDKEMSIGLYGDYDINEVIAFFNSEGIAVFSNELDKYYRYEIINQIDFDRLIRYRTATVTMHCQPFKYSTTEEEIVLSGTVITGEGTNLNLANTEEDGAFTDLEVKGDTFQQTYSGKNLLGIPDQTFTHATVTVTIANGEITLNGTANSTGTKWLEPIKTTTINGNYTSSITYISGTAPTSNVGNFNIRHASDGTVISGTQVSLGSSNRNVQFSVNEDTSIIFGIYVQNNTTYNNYKFKPQLEVGSSATDYEPYVGGIPSPNPDYPQTVQTVTGNNSVLICGKNLFDYNDIVSSANYTNNYDGSFVRNSDGRSITINCNSASQPYNVFKLKRGTYSVSFDILLTGAMTIGNVNVQTYQNGTLVSITKTLGISIPANISTHIKLDNCVIENDAEAVGIAISNIQIEVGSTATDYEAYESQTYPINLGTIELCRIGDNEDYIFEENGNWYKHSEIQKIDLTSLDNLSRPSSWANKTAFYQSIPYGHGITGYKTIAQLYCNRLISDAPDSIAGSSKNRIGLGGGGNNIYISIDGITTRAGYISYFENNPTYLYFILAEPTETEITDTTLISQLNSLYSATTYLGETNIITSGSDLPPIIYVQTYAVENPVINVTNSGNIYSKPLITIYGQGNIDLYLNGSQVFNIALGNEEYITIDVANMEATQDGVLKNRLVTGDYDNFVLQPGENEITFTGALYSMTIEDYSRWV